MSPSHAYLQPFAIKTDLEGKAKMNNTQAPWAGMRERLYRPPDRGIGLIAVVASAAVAAVAIGLAFVGEPSDGRMGPYARFLTPAFVLLTALSSLLSGLSDFRSASDMKRIVHLRMLSTAIRIVAFAVFGTMFLGLLFA
jgi:hypothetical protein